MALNAHLCADVPLINFSRLTFPSLKSYLLSTVLICTGKKPRSSNTSTIYHNLTVQLLVH